MFTGIIEEMGRVKSLDIKQDGNLHIQVEASLAGDLKLNESVSHNGACLSVMPQTKTSYEVIAIKETISRTNLKHLKIGDKINLERSLPANGRIDGHFVLGHIDTTVKCKSVQKLKGSHIFTFICKKEDLKLIVEKGSVALNGVSLTIADIAANTFSVAIIPYTFERTNFKNIEMGDEVNVEYDILGKYIVQQFELPKK
jgi:riboflavin synthase